MAQFSKHTIEFFVENRLRDDKAWFDAHRADYRAYVVDPFVSLLGALGLAMAEIDEKIVLSPKAGGSISRIWRDTRFSKDKSLYRDSMWLSLLRQKSILLPEFFFVITPDEYLYGCGYYAAQTGSMECIREMVLSGSAAFKAAYAMYEKQDRFALEGDLYKRSRYPDQPEHLKNWLDRKVIALTRTSKDFDLLFSDRLADTLIEDFRLIAPAYHFFIKAEEKARKAN